MKKLLLILTVMVLLVGGLSAPAFSNSVGVINVTADVAQLSVTVSPDTISYGLVPMNTTGVLPDITMIFATNTGNCFVDMQIKGANTTDWALGETAGENIYVHYWGYYFPALTYTKMSTDYDDLCSWESYAPYTKELFFLMMDTPTSSSSYGTQETTVTVMVTYEEEGIRGILEAGGPYTAGTANITATANITDQDNNPVTGLTTESNFLAVNLFSGTPPDLTWLSDLTLTAEWTEVGGGIYTGEIGDISSLTAGDYFLWAHVNDGTHVTEMGDPFVIEESP